VKEVMAIAVGGAVGSVLRYGLSVWVHGLAGRGFPYGTLVVNVLGCFAMGWLFVMFLERFAASPVWRAGLLIGVLGGFTTFSSFSIETWQLMEEGELAKVVLNVLGSVLLCLTATGVGMWLGRSL
jgi:CrcB protein